MTPGQTVWYAGQWWVIHVIYRNGLVILRAGDIYRQCMLNQLKPIEANNGSTGATKNSH